MPHLLFNSLEDGVKGLKLEAGKSSLNSEGNRLLFPIKELSILLCFPPKILSALQAKARRFTGRSELIILSKKIAGKLNLGITLSSYDKMDDDDLQHKRWEN